MRWAEKNELCLESEYKYTGSAGTCKQSECTNKYSTVYRCHNVCPNNPDAFKAALTVEPLSITVEASSPEFRFYQSGVLKTQSCGTANDHGVLAVGYGPSGTEFAIVKNSWGHSWGDNGFVKISLDNSDPFSEEGVCGIFREISYPDSQ